VTIGVTQTPGPMDVPRLLATFNHRYAGVELILREGLSVNLVDDLREDRLDLALISAVGARERRQLQMQRCQVERLAALLPADHRLATRRSVTIADLRDERFVSFSPGATIRQTVERAAARAGFVPRASLETNDVDRIAALVAEGLGVAVLPVSDARRHPDAVAVALRGPAMRYEIFAAWRAHRQLTPAAQALRDTILASARETDAVATVHQNQARPDHPAAGDPLQGAPSTISPATASGRTRRTRIRAARGSSRDL
jgi:DNA-binding transcriptional LysR family regulator